MGLRAESTMSVFVRARAYMEGIELKELEPSLKALCVLLGLFAVFHVSELANFTLSIDDEFSAFRNKASVWIAQGRWATYLFERFVLPRPVVPFLPLALFGFFCSIGYLFFLRAIGERHATPLAYAFFPFFSSFPTWVHLTAFQSNTPSAGLGVLLCCAAACLYRKEREQSEQYTQGTSLVALLTLTGLLGAAATGCYQSFILLLAVVLLASLISMYLSNRPVRLLLKDLLLIAAILAASLILYTLILKFCILTAKVKVDYIQGFLRPEILLDRPIMVLSGLFRRLGNIYFGHSTVFGINARSFAVLVILAAACLIGRAHYLGGLRGGILAALAIPAFLFVPFAINLMSGGNMPLRSMVAVPAAFAGLGLLGFKYAPRWLSHIGILVLIVSYFAIFQIQSGFNAARQLVQLHDQAMAGALSERIARVASYANPPKQIKLEVFGAQPFKTPFPRIEGSTIGASFFEWDRGSPYRIASYMTLIGLPAARGIPREKINHKLLDEFVLMPPWPAQGSVRSAEDGTILAKLSDEPGLRYQPLLERKDPSANPNDEPFYRLSTAAAGSWSVQNAVARKTSEGIVLDAKVDSNFVFVTGAPEILRNCSRIEIHARLKIERPDNTQIFYKHSGQKIFQGQTAVDVRVSPAADDGFIDVYLQAISRNGFEDSFRFDPVDFPQHVTIGEIELFCRHQRLAVGNDEKPAACNEGLSMISSHY